jgi:hypothetical protein
MMYFMIALVMDFNDAGQVRNIKEQQAKDSTIAAQINVLLYQDSLINEALLEQAKKNDELSSQVSIIKYKLRALSEIN